MPNSATDPQHPLLVVFDTSTQTEFYADVHRVLASPAGAVLPYDYERRLTTSAAAQVLDELAGDRNAAPVDVLLMYGERRGFRKADSDPTEIQVGDTQLLAAASRQTIRGSGHRCRLLCRPPHPGDASA